MCAAKISQSNCFTSPIADFPSNGQSLFEIFYSASKIAERRMTHSQGSPSRFPRHAGHPTRGRSVAMVRRVRLPGEVHPSGDRRCQGCPALGPHLIGPQCFGQPPAKLHRGLPHEGSRPGSYKRFPGFQDGSLPQKDFSNAGPLQGRLQAMRCAPEDVDANPGGRRRHGGSRCTTSLLLHPPRSDLRPMHVQPGYYPIRGRRVPDPDEIHRHPARRIRWFFQESPGNNWNAGTGQSPAQQVQSGIRQTGGGDCESGIASFFLPNRAGCTPTVLRELGLQSPDRYSIRKWLQLDRRLKEKWRGYTIFSEAPSLVDHSSSG